MNVVLDTMDMDAVAVRRRYLLPLSFFLVGCGRARAARRRVCSFLAKIILRLALLELYAEYASASVKCQAVLQVLRRTGGWVEGEWRCAMVERGRRDPVCSRVAVTGRGAPAVLRIAGIPKNYHGAWGMGVCPAG